MILSEFMGLIFLGKEQTGYPEYLDKDQSNL